MGTRAFSDLEAVLLEQDAERGRVAGTARLVGGLRGLRDLAFAMGPCSARSSALCRLQLSLGTAALLLCAHAVATALVLPHKALPDAWLAATLGFADVAVVALVWRRLLLVRLLDVSRGFLPPWLAVVSSCAFVDRSAGGAAGTAHHRSTGGWRNFFTAVPDAAAGFTRAKGVSVGLFS